MLTQMLAPGTYSQGNLKNEIAFPVYFDEGFGEKGLHQHKSKLGVKLSLNFNGGAFPAGAAG